MFEYANGASIARICWSPHFAGLGSVAIAELLGRSSADQMPFDFGNRMFGQVLVDFNENTGSRFGIKGPPQVCKRPRRSRNHKRPHVARTHELLQRGRNMLGPTCLKTENSLQGRHGVSMTSVPAISFAASSGSIRNERCDPMTVIAMRESRAWRRIWPGSSMIVCVRAGTV
jgi:hypothetical protein